ncbi:hypothetical protein [Howardella ureilytica]
MKHEKVPPEYIGRNSIKHGKLTSQYTVRQHRSTLICSTEITVKKSY